MALSMRSLAAELSVTPMALYNHVAGKADVLDGIADLVMREAAEPLEGLPWQRRLKVCKSGVRRACLAHPGAVPLIQRTSTVTPALMWPMEVTLNALAEAGLGSEEALHGWSALVALTMGHVTYQLGGHMPGHDFDAGFAFALDLLIEGLGRAA